MRKSLFAAAAVVVTLASATLPAGAGTQMDPVVTISPTRGESGTVVTFTPTDLCPSDTDLRAANAPGDAHAAIAREPEPAEDEFLADAPVDLDGDWTLDYTVPASEALGDVTFYAFCLREPYDRPAIDTAAVSPDWIVETAYAPVVFTVTPASTTTTTTTPSSTTSTARPPAPAILASPLTVFAGESIAVEASGFAPGSTVAITLESDPVNLGTFVADSAGRLAASVVVPTDFPAGAHTLKLTGTDIAGAVLVLSTGITVASRIQVAPTPAPAPAAPAPAATTRPQTGSPVAGPALAAGALMLAGAASVAVARRRRASASR